MTKSHGARALRTKGAVNAASGNLSLEGPPSGQHTPLGAAGKLQLRAGALFSLRLQEKGRACDFIFSFILSFFIAQSGF